MSKNLRFSFVLLAALSLVSCSDVKDAIDAATLDVSRKQIDTTRMGVTNFFTASKAGSIRQQFLDIRDTLGITHVRVLFAWTNEVQGAPSASPNYSFYDSIVDAIPPGMDVLIVLAHTPNWMTNPANWIDGNPRTTWVERWLRPTVARYANRGGIVGYQVFNEPDSIIVPADEVLGLQDPALYAELLRGSSNVLRALDPNRLIVLGATRSIQQAGGSNLSYNRDLVRLGMEDVVDVWAIHYYGQQFERVIESGGIGDFINDLRTIVWITESGEVGPNSQLAYVEETWPFLRSEAPGIDRIYYYEYAQQANPFESFALRTDDAAFPVSDLYLHLQERQ